MFPNYVPKHKVFSGQIGVRRNIYNAALEKREQENNYNYEIMNKNDQNQHS